jgi:hypothetical protein
MMHVRPVASRPVITGSPACAGDDEVEIHWFSLMKPAIPDFTPCLASSSR